MSRLDKCLRRIARLRAAVTPVDEAEYDRQVAAFIKWTDSLHKKHPDDTTVLLYRGAECFSVEADEVDGYLAQGYTREWQGTCRVSPYGGVEYRQSPNDPWPSDIGKDNPGNNRA
jgi:hypothetical protein